MAVAAAGRSVAPSAVQVAARLRARPAAAAVVPWEERRRLLRGCRRTWRMRLLCRGRRCLRLRLLSGRSGRRTAAIVTPFLRGRRRRLPGRLLRGRRVRVAAVAAGLPAPAAAVAAGRLAPAAAGRGGDRSDAPRAAPARLVRAFAPAPPAPAARLGRLAAARFERAVSPGQRVAESAPGVVAAVAARAAARPEAVALLAAAPAAWASALLPAAVRACRAFQAGRPALRRTAHRAARRDSRKAALQSSAARCWSNSSELTFKRIGGRGFMVVQAPGWRFVPSKGKCVLNPGQRTQRSLTLRVVPRAWTRTRQRRDARLVPPWRVRPARGPAAALLFVCSHITDPRPAVWSLASA